MIKKYIIPNWNAPKNVHAFTSTKNVGIKKPGFANPNYTNKDFRAGMMQSNNKLKQDLDLPTDPFWIKQQHTSICINAEHSAKLPVADAAFATTPNIVCAVLTADCVPIFICDRKGGAVLAIHAGWKGIAAGIIENSIETLNLNPKNILAWLGPAIGPNKFEVGEDVYEVFVNANIEAKQAFTKINGVLSTNKWLANIYLLATQRLESKGITNIYGGDYCTYTQKELFFSYRREQNNTGHMASLIWIT